MTQYKQKIDHVRFSCCGPKVSERGRVDGHLDGHLLLLCNRNVHQTDKKLS